ncbi:DNA-3-methyladenine glycosidase [Lelliottia aquatilis]|nr:DNA-3-methyladenine glycosidase [Lelliottia aquatilis]
MSRSRQQEYESKARRAWSGYAVKDNKRSNDVHPELATAV